MTMRSVSAWLGMVVLASGMTACGDGAEKPKKDKPDKELSAKDKGGNDDTYQRRNQTPFAQSQQPSSNQSSDEVDEPVQEEKKKNKDFLTALKGVLEIIQGGNASSSSNGGLLGPLGALLNLGGSSSSSSSPLASIIKLFSIGKNKPYRPAFADHKNNPLGQLLDSMGYGNTVAAEYNPLAQIAGLLNIDHTEPDNMDALLQTLASSLLSSGVDPNTLNTNQVQNCLNQQTQTNGVSDPNQCLANQQNGNTGTGI